MSRVSPVMCAALALTLGSGGCYLSHAPAATERPDAGPDARRLEDTSCACPAPPPSECVGEDTVRTFAVGECSDGCTLRRTDTRCEGRCSSGACRPTCEPLDWSFETIASDGAFQSTSIALGPEGPRVAYADRDARTLYVATRASGAWTSGVVRRGTDSDRHVVGIQPGLWIDADGSARVLHLHANGGLNDHRLAHDEQPAGGDWRSRLAPDHPHLTDLASLAHRGSDYLAVAGWVAAGPTVRLAYVDVARRTGTNEWATSRLVTSENLLFDYPALTVDDADRAHVIFDTGDGLDYAVGTPGASFARETVDADPVWRVGMCGDIALERDGSPLATYFTVLGGRPARLREAARSADGTWQIRTIAEVERSGCSPLTLEIDRFGDAHLLYADLAGSLMYGQRDASGAWAFDAVLRGDEVYGSSMVLDAGGVVHVATVVDGEVRYGRGRVCR